MQRSSHVKIKTNLRKRLAQRPRPAKSRQPKFDVFISHRSTDTKRTIAGLLYYHLKVISGLNCFLDNKSMKPGDRLFDKIDAAIHESKLGIVVFSRRFCESYFCLHELALMMHTRKRVLPIFVDVTPSELRVKAGEFCSETEAKRFNWALEEARNIVGLSFDSSTMDWSSFLRRASAAVMHNLGEVEREKPGS